MQEQSLLQSETRLVANLSKTLGSLPKSVTPVSTLPDGPGQASLIQFLQTATHLTGVTILSTSFSLSNGNDVTAPSSNATNATAQGSLSTQPSLSLSLNVQGTLSQLLAFVHQLQSANRPVQLVSANITLPGLQTDVAESTAVGTNVVAANTTGNPPASTTNATVSNHVVAANTSDVQNTAPQPLAPAPTDQAQLVLVLLFPYTTKG